MFKLDETPGRPTLGRRKAARLVSEARRWAGLSQTEVARRVGVPVQTVNRIEHGVVDPRLGTVEAVLGACGWSLGKELRAHGDRAEIRALLALPPLQRLAGGEPSPWAGRAVRTLEVLSARGVRFLLDGPMAARLHGAPVAVPDVRIRTLAGRANAERLRAALQIANRRFLRVGVTAVSCSAEVFDSLLVMAWWLGLPAGGWAPVVSLEDLISEAPRDREDLLRCVREERQARSI